MSEMQGAEYPQAMMAEKSGAHEQLALELDRLGEQLDRFETRLSPVLNPPSPNVALSADTAISSPLRGYTDRLGSLNAKLAELLSRLDL